MDNLPFKITDTESIYNFLNSDTATNTGNWNGGQMRRTRTNSSGYYKHQNLNIAVNYDMHGEPIEVKVKGSIHTFKNNGKHNADQLTYEQFKQTLGQLCNYFNWSPQNLILSPPEFGVNISCPFPVGDIILNMMMEKRKPFKPSTEGEYSKISGSNKNDYRTKGYWKFDQPKMSRYCTKETLRLESKHIRMKALHKKGIYTIADLLQIENYTWVAQYFLDTLDHLVIYDNTIRLPKGHKDHRLLQIWNNPNYWITLVKECHSNTRYRTKYNDEVNKMNRYSKEYGSNVKETLLHAATAQVFANINGDQKPTEARLQKLRRH